MVDEVSAAGGRSVTIEEDVSAATMAALEAEGFSLRRVKSRSEELGHSNLIRVERDGYTAASDPRSDGSAIVV